MDSRKGKDKCNEINTETAWARFMNQVSKAQKATNHSLDKILGFG